jgi:hypothetical protein
MVDGERGSAILAQVVAHKMDALFDGDALTASLIGACFAEALRKDESPKQVAWELWAGLPDDFSWNGGLRDRVIEAIDEFEERNAA